MTFEVGTAFEMTVGDLESDELGTAARASAGKTRYDLLPLDQLAYLFDHTSDLYSLAHNVDVSLLLHTMAKFQKAEISAMTLLNHALALHLNTLTSEELAKQDIMGALAPVVRVWDYGRKKYAEWNWAKGAPWSVPMGCMLRHIRLQIISPDVPDVDSGESHTAHIVCNAQMLAHYSMYWNHEDEKADDRPVKFFTSSDRALYQRP